jgi:nucleotide-binding universal stress UspA family protein
MKTQIFLPLVTYPDCNSDAVAANAATVAACLNADLVATALNVDIPPVSSALSRLLLDLPEMSRQAEAISQKRGDQLLATVAEEANRKRVPVTTNSLKGSPALLGEVAGEWARYFDLTLIGWDAGNQACRMTAEAVVFGSGRPAILMPGLTSIGQLDRVAIAWDGSRVAARAVADALPFFERASKIHVLTVVDEKPLKKDIAERLVDGLHRRGLVGTPLSVKAQDRPIGVILQEHAINAGAHLLVMGGYGHSRVRDFVLGGATRGILDDLRLPVLFSH